MAVPPTSSTTRIAQAAEFKTPTHLWESEVIIISGCTLAYNMHSIASTCILDLDNQTQTTTATTTTTTTIILLCSIIKKKRI